MGKPCKTCKDNILGAQLEIGSAASAIEMGATMHAREHLAQAQVYLHHAQLDREKEATKNDHH